MMDARQLTIESKHRQYHRFLASLKDFSYREDGEVNPRKLLDNPQMSLYCLDESNRQAVFVEISVGIDLAKVPFVCRTQYEQARRLMTVPYVTFNQLADRLPPVEQPIFIYTTGRSGSTLLHHVLNESGVAVSLSEPDTPTQFANLRHGRDDDRDGELSNLARSSLRFLFKNYRDRDIRAHALKFRSHGTQVMDLFQAVFPHAKNIFLYRQVLDFLTSNLRIYQNREYPVYSSFQAWRNQFEHFWGADLSQIEAYEEEIGETMTILKEATLEWILTMEWYRAQCDRGIPALTLRYTDLIHSKEETANNIFKYCNLPLDTVRQALQAYSRDSQSGTPLGRKNTGLGDRYRLNETQREWVAKILMRHPFLELGDRVSFFHEKTTRESDRAEPK
ncbi:MAG: sulfotransferase [Cyanobacteria bacterium SBLK]|nr:sulfotransferase [Cyanobacteria bacterium SBLK]